MSKLSVQIEQYLYTCKFEKKLSPDTLKAYHIDLKQFMNFAEEAQVDKVLLGQYIVHLNCEFSPRSVKRKLASIRAFYNALEENEDTFENPFRSSHFHITYPKELPRTIPEKSVEQLLKAAYRQHENKGDIWTLRDIMILELLFGTGIRVSELCKLTLDTFQVGADYLWLLIHGKGKKERVLRITTPEIVSLAGQYLKILEKEAAQQGFIFLNRRGRALSTQGVRQIITQYVKIAGLSGHVTPHMFRHTFATALLDAGVDIRYIQSLLGHSSISTTEIYTHVATERQSEILAQCHPRNKMFFQLK